MIGVTKDIAADAAELPLVWLEVTYRATRRAALAERAHVVTQKHLPCSLWANGGLGGLTRRA